jgi:predicted RNA binding protein YcfA (HicA-like mRNA interferase family)
VPKAASSHRPLTATSDGPPLLSEATCNALSPKTVSIALRAPRPFEAPFALTHLLRTTFRLYDRSVTGKDLVRLLQQHGWTLEHIRGSHHILRKGGRTLSVPVHPGRDLGKGLLVRLLKEAGLK